MKVEDNWRFMSADFSVQASGKMVSGIVTLVRCKEEKEKWHKLSEKYQKLHELYIVGHGYTLEEAIHDANKKARVAKQIPSETMICPNCKSILTRQHHFGSFCHDCKTLWYYDVHGVARNPITDNIIRKKY